MSPDFLPPARCDVFHARKGNGLFKERPSTKAISPFSRGKNRISQGVENRGSLITVPLALREHKHFRRDGLRDKPLGQTGLSLFNSTVKSLFCPVCPWDRWGFVPGTIVPRGPSKKCFMCFLFIVFLLPCVLSSVLFWVHGEKRTSGDNLGQLGKRPHWDPPPYSSSQSIGGRQGKKENRSRKQTKPSTKESAPANWCWPRRGSSSF